MFVVGVHRRDVLCCGNDSMKMHGRCVAAGATILSVFT